jgi:phenylalanyl-tRNA synthetase beta subunit
MRNTELRDRIISEVCQEFDVDEAFILELLSLESEHGDLLAWGARPNLRRDIATVVDRAVSSSNMESGVETSSR